MPNQLLLAIRSLIFYIGHYLIIAVFSVVGILLKPLALTTRLRFMRLGVNLCLFWLRITCNIRHKIHNKSCIDSKQPSIILSRHESTWEALAFHTIFPLQINVVKKELIKIPFFGFILVTINSILIDRTQTLKAIKQVKREGKQAILGNLWVVIFPGGTRIKPGELSNIQSGGAILAKQENVPVYLVTHNSGTVWPKASFIKQPGVINVYIKPLKNIHNKDIQAINNETKEWLQSPIISTLPSDLVTV